MEICESLSNTGEINLDGMN
ncbi:hypothetical protein C5167_050330 [Papaver somniferum]|uniref:Uncharacterized protein n=1 Tax=Papaver somniferum TaxID=3469 RepID=A0A4Y7KRS3_PAPSO|nr:hypothetical protein C5167_050330 [Papaver somniferum]